MKNLKDSFYAQVLDDRRAVRLPMKVEHTTTPPENNRPPYTREHEYVIKFGRQFFCLDADIHSAQKSVYLELKEFLYGDIQGAFLLLEMALFESGATFDPDVHDRLQDMRTLLEEI